MAALSTSAGSSRSPKFPMILGFAFVMLAIVGVGAGLYVASTEDRARPAATLPTGSAPPIETETLTPVAGSPGVSGWALGDRLAAPRGLAVDGTGAVWLAEQNRGVVSRLAVDGTLERFRIDREYEGTGAYDVLVTEDGSVWFTSYPGGTLGRIGPDGDAAVFQPAGDPSATLSLAADDTGSIWVSDPRRSALVQVHPDGGLDQYAVPPVDERTSLPRDLTSAPDGRIWFTDPGTGTIRSLDPARPAGVRNVKAGRPDDELRSIAAAPGGVIWATFAERPALAKVEDREVTVLPVPVRGGLNDVAVADDGTIWITTPTEEVLHLSADGTEVLARYRLPAGATYADDLAIAADGSVWAAATDAAVIVRFDPAE